MFCPNCGASFRDGARFCPECGCNVAERATAPAPGGSTPSGAPAPSSAPKPVIRHTSGSPVPTAAPDAPAAPGAATPGSPAPKAAKKLPVIPIAILAAVLVVGGLIFVGRKAIMKTFGHLGYQVEAAKEPGKKGETGTTLDEEDPNRISPKESIKIKSCELSTDSVNRYVITGTIENTSDETYVVQLTFDAVEHSSDAYGEEVTNTVSVSSFDCADPFNRGDYSTLILYDVEPGTRSFTIYPSWSSVELQYDNPTCYVDSVSLPDAQSEWRFDHDGLFEVNNLRYTQDGKVTGSYYNNTELYLSEVNLNFALINKDKLPAVYDNSGARPCGAVTAGAEVNLIKPGDSGTFEVNVGEGYNDVVMRDVQITPDKSKNSFN